MSEPSRHSKPGNGRWELPCDLDSVRTVTGAVHDFLLAHGCQPDEARDCELALVEACNNAIQYTQPDERRSPVVVEARCDRLAVELRVADRTPGFDWPERFALPDPECEHGRGLYLIQSLMDSAQYLHQTEGNTLVLLKQRAV